MRNIQASLRRSCETVDFNGTYLPLGTVSDLRGKQIDDTLFQDPAPYYSGKQHACSTQRLKSGGCCECRVLPAMEAPFGCKGCVADALKRGILRGQVQTGPPFLRNGALPSAASPWVSRFRVTGSMLTLAYQTSLFEDTQAQQVDPQLEPGTYYQHLTYPNFFKETTAVL